MRDKQILIDGEKITLKEWNTKMKEFIDICNDFGGLAK